MSDVAERIGQRVSAIRDLVEDRSTTSVVGWCLSFNLRSANELDWHSVLHSPARQISFLLGLLLASPEPTDYKELTDDEWHRVLELLNDAFDQYQPVFYPSLSEAKELSEGWWRARDVAMPAFFHYAFGDLMASTEQVEDRIGRYLAPFDEAVTSIWGMDTGQAAHIARWISQRLQASLDRMMDVREEIEAARNDLLGRESMDWTLNTMRAEAERDYPDLGDRLLASLNDLGGVHLEELVAAFPETSRSFWAEFTIARGDGEPITFPTERTAFDDRPLILTSASTAICPSPNAVFSAILKRGESAIRDGPLRAQYLRHRDRSLESEASGLFKRWFGTEAECFEGLFETPDRSLEHDIVVLADRRCLVVECKASPPKEPFRDPDKAFTRLAHAFRAETGIQHAFDQANRVCRRVRHGETVTLYDHSGEQALSIRSADVDGIYAVCVTRDDYGPLATNLNLLLSKDDEDPFPWVVNVFDLQALCEAREYLELPPEYLLRYLEERLPLNGKAWTSDELDMFAFRLKHGTLDWIGQANTDFFVMDPSYASVFDEIYRARTADGPPVKLQPTPPVITDLRASLEKGKLVTIPSRTSGGDVPRNAPCLCGSGRKYKKCCGHPRNR